MIKDKKFHELIERQDLETKEQNLQKLKSSLDTSDYASIELDNGKSTKILIRSPKVILTTLLLVIVVTIGIFLAIFIPRKSKDKIRFCSQNDYTSEMSDFTLKDYSLQMGGKLLYFDWYDDTEFYNNYVLKLNSTGEIICYQEVIYDNAEGYAIYIYITDTKTEIDFLNHYKTCNESEIINGVEVKYSVGDTCEYATFIFKDFKYYIDVSEAESSALLLSYIEQLLKI